MLSFTQNYQVKRLSFFIPWGCCLVFSGHFGLWFIESSFEERQKGGFWKTYTRTDRCNIFHGFTRDICGNDRRDSTWREDCLWYDNGSRLKNLGKQNCILVLELCIVYSEQKKTFACIVFVFKNCTEKTGLALVSTLHNSFLQQEDPGIMHFTCTAFSNHPWLPAWNWSWEYGIFSYGQNLMSKVWMVNKDISQYNPRCQVTHCGCNQTALVCSHIIRENGRHAKAHDLS